MDERRLKVGKRIQRARRAAGHKSAKAFAEALGISPTSVARAEAGWDTTGAGVYADIEGALKWPDEIIARYLKTGDEALLARMQIRSEAAAAAPQEWSATARRLVLAMTADEISELGRTIDDEQARIRWMHAALRVKQEAAAIEPENTPH